jgi:hypothetical protein
MTHFTLLADWVALNEQGGAVSGQTYAEALLRACADLPDEVLRNLPALPDAAAEALASEPFAGRLEGHYLAAEWLESVSSALDLALAEIESGWDIGDGRDVYFCPLVEIAEDSHEPDQLRAFIRVDRIRRWT